VPIRFEVIWILPPSPEAIAGRELLKNPDSVKYWKVLGSFIGCLGKIACGSSQLDPRD